MTRSPRMRFLGLGAEATDHELLGLPAESTPTEAEIRDALQSRLRYLDRHPGGTGNDAIVVRTARTPPPPRPRPGRPALPAGSPTSIGRSSPSSSATADGTPPVAGASSRWPLAMESTPPPS